MFPSGDTQIFTTWNTEDYLPNEITSGLYDDYEELMAITERDYFLGVVLNDNHRITNAYSCGMKNNIPFCIEGFSDGTKYSLNNSILQDSALWDNTCQYDSNDVVELVCNNHDVSSLEIERAESFSNGYVKITAVNGGLCTVYNHGVVACYNNDPN